VENRVKKFGHFLYRATGREVGERSKRGKFWCDFRDLRNKIFTIYSKNANGRGKKTQMRVVYLCNKTWF